MGRRLFALLRAVIGEMMSDRVMMVAGGLAFYGVFGLLPALAVIAAMVGRFVDTEAIKAQLGTLSEVLPPGVTDLLGEFLTSVPAGFGWDIGLWLNIAIVLWTAQRSASGLMTALNIVFDENEKRGRMRRFALSVAVAAGGLLFLFLALFLVAILPLSATALDPELAYIVMRGRWPLLTLLFMTTLGLLYCWAPSRGRVRLRWISWGAAVATVLWLGASALFSAYVFHAGDLGRYYGSLTAAVVLMTWMFISALIILIGAEINAQLAGWRDGKPGLVAKRQLDRHERTSRDPG